MTQFTNSIILKTFSILLIFTIKYSYGQPAISGVVTDSLHNPVSSVSVVLKSNPGHTMITYGYTDEKGYYTLETLQTGDFILTYSSLSHQTVHLPITIATPDQHISKDVVLQEETQLLDEVVFKVDIPIKVKKDTIVFKASSFMDGTEEVAEDILKKLPGVDVDASGTISIQGKAIEKVMVEGDDLFERGYKLLTKNLNSGVIDKVEILQNFSSNSLLKGIEDSDKVALNITLKEDRKTTFFGNASAGYGTKQFYENKVNLISFTKKTKYYFFGNLTNTGLDPTGDIEQIIRPVGFSEIQYPGDHIGVKALITLNGTKPALKDQRVNFNNAEFASLNGIYNPTEKLKIKGLAFVNTDEQDFFRTNTTRFLIGDGFTNQENSRTLKKKITGFGKWDAIYTINPNSRIAYTGKYKYTDRDDSAGLFFNDTPIRQQLTHQSTFADQRVTYTRSTKNKNALLITGRYIYTDTPQNYTTAPFIFESLFPANTNIASLTQRSTTSTNFAGIESNYISNGAHTNIDIKVGYRYQNELLNSELILTDQNGSTDSAGLDYVNDLRYLSNDIYGKIRYKYQLGALGVIATLETHQLFTDINNEGIRASDQQLYTIPNIALNWSINKKNKLTGIYRYTTKNFSLSDIYDGIVLSGFRNFNRGVGNFDQLNGSFFLANYTYGAWTDEFLMNASFLYQQDDTYLSSDSRISRAFNISRKIVLEDKNFYSLHINMDKYIAALSSNFKLYGNLSDTKYQNIVNDTDIRNVKSQGYTYGIEVRSAFAGFFNFHAGTKWVTTAVETSTKNTNTDTISFLDLSFDPSGKFVFQLSNERYYFGSLDQNNTYYFTDFDAQYTIKKNALTLKFTAQNIWNTDNFANYMIGDTAISNTNYRLLPRYFLLKLDFRF